MKHLLTILALLAAPALGENWWTRTNDVNGLTPSTATITGTVGAIRVGVTALDGGGPRDLTGLWIRMDVTASDGYTASYTGIVENATAGLARGLGSVEEGTNTVRVMAVPESAPESAFPLSWDTMIVTSPPSTAPSIVFAPTTSVSSALSSTTTVEMTFAPTTTVSVGGSTVSVNNAFAPTTSVEVIVNAGVGISNLTVQAGDIAVASQRVEIASGAFSGALIGDQTLEVDLQGNLTPIDSRSIVPRGNNQTDLGSPTQQHRRVYAVEVLVDNVSLPKIPKATPDGVLTKTLQFNSVSSSYYWSVIYQATSAVPIFGTAIKTTYYRTASSVGAIQQHVSVGSQMVVHAWGAGAGGTSPTLYGGPGGYVYSEIPTVAGSLYDVLVGAPGQYATGPVLPGGFPGGGNSRASAGASSGAGFSGLRLYGTADYLVIAAGGGGSGAAAGATGGAGGGILGGDGGKSVNTNILAKAYGADGFTIYSTNYLAGTNEFSGVGSSGSYLTGGNATNLGTFAILGLGGGGGGQGGGAGGLLLSNTTVACHAGGSGGCSWANKSLVSFAYTVRSITTYFPPESYNQYYVAGFAYGASAAPFTGGTGLVVIVEY